VQKTSESREAVCISMPTLDSEPSNWHEIDHIRRTAHVKPASRSTGRSQPPQVGSVRDKEKCEKRERKKNNERREVMDAGGGKEYGLIPQSEGT